MRLAKSSNVAAALSVFVFLLSCHHSPKADEFRRFTFVAANCVAGTSGSGGSCVPCSAGTYSDVDGLTSCFPCNIGTYSGSPGSTTCSICSSGTYGNMTALTSCFTCPPGTFAPFPSSFQCTPCFPGTFNPTPAATTCAPCAPGTYANTTSIVDPYVVGATSCDSCPSSTYQSQFGQSTCSTCVGSNPNSITCNSAAGGPCSGGQYLNVNDNRCHACAPGSFGTGGTATSCQLCPDGFYQFASSTSACIPCPPGSFSNTVGSVNCTACPSGTTTYFSAQTSCMTDSNVAWPGGSFYSTITSLPSGWSGCMPGQEFASSTCQLCHPGNYQPQIGGTSCLPCPLGTAQPSFGQTACLNCASGAVSGLTGQTQCSSCSSASGQFQSLSGQTQCSSCSNADAYSQPWECVAGTASSSTTIAYVITYVTFRGQSTTLPTSSQILSAVASSSMSLSSSVMLTVTNISLINNHTYVQLRFNDSSANITSDVTSVTTALGNAASSLSSKLSTMAQLTVDTSYPPVTGSTTAFGIGDPHFTGFDGSSFDFIGDEAVYNLFSSALLQVNAHFKLSCCPHHYPNVSKPMWMDAIAVIYGNHTFQYDVYDDPAARPRVDGEHFLSPLKHFEIDATVQLLPFNHAFRRYTHPRHSPRFLYYLLRHPDSVNISHNEDVHVGEVDLIQASVTATAGAGPVFVIKLTNHYTVEISLHNDEWHEQYMDLKIVVHPAACTIRSTGLIGQTRHPPSIDEALRWLHQSTCGDVSTQRNESTNVHAEVDAETVSALSNGMTTMITELLNLTEPYEILSAYWMEKMECASSTFKLQDNNLLSAQFEENLFLSTF